MRADSASFLLAAAAGRPLDTGDSDVVFRRQPRPVPARQRIPYRSALLALVLAQFNRNAASLTHLHTIMWAMRTAGTRQMFTAWWKGRRFSFSSTERLDPDLEVTLNLALVDGLVTLRPNGRVQLTDLGVSLAQRLVALDGVLSAEKAFLSSLSGLSDAKMNRLLGEVST